MCFFGFNLHSNSPGYYYTLLTGKETEAQGGQVICQRAEMFQDDSSSNPRTMSPGEVSFYYTTYDLRVLFPHILAVYLGLGSY